MAFPEAYKGRAQTYLKHEFLKEYLQPWAFKLARFKRKLWYVDCFAGPWDSAMPTLEDTSIHIGLQALRTADAHYRAKGERLELGAIFIEPDPDAFAKLQQFVSRNSLHIDAHCLQGTFAERSTEVQRLLGTDPAFMFVDPWGWTGAEMKHIEPFLRHKQRDVLVNVMFNFLNIAQGNRNATLQKQLADFFGLSPDEALDASGERMFELYRKKLTDNCDTKWTAVLPIPNKAYERTWFGLVVGGNNAKVLEVFRNAEAKTAERARDARESEKRDQRSKRKASLGQPELLLPPSSDPFFEERHRDGLDRLEREMMRALRQSAQRFDELWAPILAELSVTRAEVADAVLELKRRDVVDVVGLEPPRRAVNDDHIIRLRVPPVVAPS